MKHIYKLNEKVKIVRINDGYPSEQKYVGKIGVIESINSYHSIYKYQVVVDGDNISFAEECLSKTDKTLDDLEKDDVVVKDSRERTILEVFGRLYFMGYKDDTGIFVHAGTYTLDEIKKSGWEVKTEPIAEEEVQEMTVAEIEAFVGKKVKIVK